MTTAGWITMIVSVGSVTLLCIWTMTRVLRTHQPDHDLAHVEPIDKDHTAER
jgi:ABC-type nickel/cobalt efflux system permease component RcnA